MTMPAVVRIFFAIDLAAETKQAIGALIGTFKKQAKTHALRWSRPENLHITLQFLAEVRVEHVPVLMAEVRKKLQQAQPKALALTIGKLILFPNPFRPRVLVLDVDSQAELGHLSALIGEGIQMTNYMIEDRPFHAHLTIGRIKHVQENVLNFLTKMGELPSIDHVMVNEVVLFRSDPQPDGSHYTLLDKITLT